MGVLKYVKALSSGMRYLDLDQTHNIGSAVKRPF